MDVYILFFVYILLHLVGSNMHLFKKKWNAHDVKFGYFSPEDRMQMREKVREMFYFGYDNYMEHAFPEDELDPIHCTGRGPDYANPSNININDVLGDYALTLVDSLDTLAIMGNSSEFKRAVKLVIETVSFDKSNTVQVFEANIRVLGALLSAHLIITDPKQPFGDMTIEDYNNELLLMAHDLASRFLPAFENTATGIPYPRVNLRDGVPVDTINETCTSGAGTLLLEFGMLSRLLADPVFETVARRALRSIWSFKSNVTGLLGNVINVQTGKWVGVMSGMGAGLDSLYEYMLKAFVVFGDQEYLQMFNESYETIRYYLRKGRKHCTKGTGFPPIYVNVHMKTGEIINNWIDALQAAFAGLQVLAGDIDEAICTHALYYSIWRRYKALPERFNWYMAASDVHFYPLRPELVESTYLLYQATKNPFYLHVGKEIYENLNKHTKAECGYATIHDVRKMDLEDRMESFFLSETCKYLYLLFDEENPVNVDSSQYVFSTEGHVFPLWRKEGRKKPWDEKLFNDPPLMQPRGAFKHLSDINITQASTSDSNTVIQPAAATVLIGSNYTQGSCQRVPQEQQYFMPLDSQYLEQMISLIGV